MEFSASMLITGLTISIMGFTINEVLLIAAGVILLITTIIIAEVK